MEDKKNNYELYIIEEDNISAKDTPVDSIEKIAKNNYADKSQNCNNANEQLLETEDCRIEQEVKKSKARNTTLIFLLILVITTCLVTIYQSNILKIGRPQKPALQEENVQLGAHWIKDESKGVLIWNPKPKDGDTVVWEGDTLLQGNAIYANGQGKATWYKDGKFVQSDEGNHIAGKRSGKIVQKFASGNSSVSEWADGEKVR